MKEFLFKINTIYLIDAFKSVKELVKEVNLEIFNGLKINAVDPANVGLVDIIINKNRFISWNEEITLKKIGVNTDIFYKLIKDLKKTNISVYLDEFKLYLEFDNGFKSELSLINVESEHKAPDLNFEAVIKLKSKRFKEIIKQFNNISDAVKIEILNNELYFKTNNDINNTKINLNPDEYTLKKDYNGDVISSYSVEYLNKFIKTTISEEVVLNLSNYYPLKVNYEVDGFKINYILVPRILNDD